MLALGVDDGDVVVVDGDVVVVDEDEATFGPLSSGLNDKPTPPNWNRFELQHPV